MKENNNPLMADETSAESDGKIPSQPLGFNKPHQSRDIKMEQQQEGGSFFFSTCSHDGGDKNVTQNPSSAAKTHLSNKEKMLQELVSVPAHDVAKETVVPEALGEDSVRERLKRHRVEVAGRVWIPDIWGQEELLKDWIDCTAFDAPIVPSRIMTARAALVEEGRRANAAGLRIENGY